MSICCSKEMLELNSKWSICEICGLVLHIKAKRNGRIKRIYHRPDSKVALAVKKRMAIKIAAV